MTLYEKRILVVDDEDTHCRNWEVAFDLRQMDSQKSVLRAKTLDEAMRLFMANRQHIAAVVCDGEVDARGEAGIRLTCEFIAYLRMGWAFRGPIVAASSRPEALERMKTAGASHKVPVMLGTPRKDLAMEMCFAALGIPAPAPTT